MKGKLKIVIFTVLTVALCAAVIFAAVSCNREKPKFSELSEAEAMRVFAEMGVELPEDWTWEKIQKIIIRFETYPDLPPVISSPATYLIYQDIQCAVREYYGMEPIETLTFDLAE